MSERIDKSISRVALALNLDQLRLRTWVSFLALCGVLERAIEEGVIRDYYIKGGVALELRFGDRARATKDVDIGLEGDRFVRLRALDAAIALGFDRFGFRRKGTPYTLEQVDTVRIEIAITHKGRSFQTLDVDLGPAGELHDLVQPEIRGLNELGLPVTSPVRCLTLAVQVAQKIHAATNPRIVNDPKQNRARDILDVLLVELLGQLDVSAVSEASMRIFKERNEHTWPPSMPVYPRDWKERLVDMASNLGYPLTDADQMIQAFQKTISRTSVM
jgi:hypothetical protein